MVSTPAPLSQRRSFTDRQMEIIEVVLVCAFAFGISILASTHVFFGGAYSHNYNSFAWEMQGMREVLCLALLWYLLRRRGRSFYDLGLTWSWKDIAWSVVLVFAGPGAFRLVYFLIGHSGLAPFSSTGASEEVGKFLFSGGIFFGTFLFQFINPFFEELIVRAYLMTEVKRLTNSVTTAVLASTVLQTSYHFYQGGPAAISDGACFLVFSIFYASRIAPVILAHLYMDAGSTLVYWLRS
jgi:membrane protease YdiL (CAAX protease family)